MWRQLKITRRAVPKTSESLNLYLKALTRSPVLTPEEEVELIRRAQAGDRRALEKVIHANLRFVVAVARQFTGYGLPIEDLISEGNIGLLRALKTYDPTLGFKFISYAVWWIRQAIVDAIREYGNITRVPQNKRISLRKINMLRRQMLQEEEREPTVQEIARACQTSIQEVVAFLRALQAPVPLNSGGSVRNGTASGTHTEEERTLEEILPDPSPPMEEQVERVFWGRIFREAIRRLSSREQRIVEGYFGLNGYGLPKSVEQLAQEEGCSVEWIRQSLKKAIRKLGRILKECCQMEMI